MKYTFVYLTIAILVFNACSDQVDLQSLSCNKDALYSPKLITVGEAFSYQENPHTIFIEVSKSDEYLSGHLPNALQVWRPDFRNKVASPFTGMRCSASELTTFLQTLGVEKNSKLILYDAKGGCDAMRLAWVFDYYGYKSYQVINGGKVAWVQAGFSLSRNPEKAISKPDFVFDPQVDSSYLATVEDVQKGILDKQTIIVDTRESYEYAGQCFTSNNEVLAYKKGAFSRGCISTAVHLNWSDLSDLEEDHRVKCEKDLRYNLAQKGITQDKQIIVYCQSGSRSSHTAFVLREILDFPNVKNYDGSWIEWSYNASQDNSFLIDKLTSQEDFEVAFRNYLEEGKVEL